MQRALLVALLLVACGDTGLPNGRAAGPAPDGAWPNLLFITLDTTRRDHLSVYDYSFPTSPNLAAFAAEGVRFDTAYAPTASTAPSHATFFTGLHPVTHGLVKNGLRLPGGNPTLAERLRAAGYQTSAVVSSFVLDKRFGLDRGFDHYDDEFVASESTNELEEWEGHTVDAEIFDRRGDHTTDRALAWLREEREPTRSFFLFVHYFDAHLSYKPPKRFLEAVRGGRSPDGDGLSWIAALYDGELRFVDHEVGRLLRGLSELGLESDTAVAIASDHGEGLMQHGVLGHGINIYDEAVRIPWLLRYPGVLPAGTVISEPVEGVDVAPTLLALLGLERDLAPSDGMDAESTPKAGEAADGAIGPTGRNLLPALRGETALDEDWPVHLHRRPYERREVGIATRVLVEGELFGLRIGRWKYIQGKEIGTRELFDLASDPGERRNLASRNPVRAREMEADIAHWLEANRRAHPARPGLPEFVRDALESLGYVE